MHIGADEDSDRIPLPAGLRGHVRLNHLLKLIDMPSICMLKGVNLEVRDTTRADSVSYQEMLDGTHLPGETASLCQLGGCKTHCGLALRDVLEIGRQCR